MEVEQIGDWPSVPQPQDVSKLDISGLATLTGMSLTGSKFSLCLSPSSFGHLSCDTIRMLRLVDPPPHALALTLTSLDDVEALRSAGSVHSMQRGIKGATRTFTLRTLATDMGILEHSICVTPTGGLTFVAADLFSVIQALGVCGRRGFTDAMHQHQEASASMGFGTPITHPGPRHRFQPQLINRWKQLVPIRDISPGSAMDFAFGSKHGRSCDVVFGTNPSFIIAMDQITCFYILYGARKSVLTSSGHTLAIITTRYTRAGCLEGVPLGLACNNSAFVGAISMRVAACVAHGIPLSSLPLTPLLVGLPTLEAQNVLASEFCEVDRHFFYAVENMLERSSAAKEAAAHSTGYAYEQLDQQSIITRSVGCLSLLFGDREDIKL